MRQIEIVTFPDGQLLDVAGPLQAFASCNDLLAERGLAPAYATAVLATGGGAVTTSSGLACHDRGPARARAPCDTLIVAGGRGTERAASDQAAGRVARRPR